jgi:hypothetical protein
LYVFNESVCNNLNAAYDSHLKCINRSSKAITRSHAPVYMITIDDTTYKFNFVDMTQTDVYNPTRKNKIICIEVENSILQNNKKRDDYFSSIGVKNKFEKCND